MSLSLPNSKELEYLVITHDPMFEDTVRANEIVKEFIIAEKLILYGGTALDYALRLKGDHIYPDDLLKVPDLDFYSPTHVEHAYKLADILYKAGFKEARAIVAMHAETMKVDIGLNHWIADISYKQRALFDSLPTLTYNGMKIVSMLYQRIDIHSSLSFPFDEPPREVVFARWSKDIKRFNKLAEHYPSDDSGLVKEDYQLGQCTVPINYHRYVFGGFAAYSILHHEFAKLGLTNDKVLAADIKITEEKGIQNITFTGDEIEFMHFDINKLAAELQAVEISKYRPFANLIPLRLEARIKGTALTIYSTKNKLLSVNSVEISGQKFRIPNAQYLLKHFLGQYFAASEKKSLYLAAYNSIIMMMRSVEELYMEQGDLALLRSPFFPSVNVYGACNISSAKEIQLNRLRNELDNEPLIPVPYNYYPDRSKGMPTFDYNIEIFRDDGSKIEEETK